MAIKQIGPGLWLLDVRLVRGGHEFRKREEFKGAKHAAESRFHEIKRRLADKADHKATSLKDLSFAEALDFYLERKNVGSNVHYFERLKADLGPIPLSDLPGRFDRWLLLLRRTKSIQTGKLLSPGTVNRFISWSKAALNHCVAYGIIKENGLAHFKKSKEIPRDLVLSDLDKENLFNVLNREAPYLLPIVQFALLVPVRTGEILQMRREDLDLFHGAIRVPYGVMKNKELSAWKPIPPSMRDYFTSLPSSSDYLFPRRVGRRYVQIKEFPYHSFRRYLKLAKIPGWRLHDARHEAVSGLLNGNTPEMVVCQIAGWTSSAMLRTYYHRDGLQSLKLVRFASDLPAPAGQSLDKLTANS